MDHYALTVKQGEVIGLTPEDFEKAEIPAMVRACFYAWHHIAMRSHWLAAYTASHMLERRNNGKIVNGGGMSYRVGKKFENELGINLKRMISLDVHVVADMDLTRKYFGNIRALREDAAGLRVGVARCKCRPDGRRPCLSRRAGFLHGADPVVKHGGSGWIIMLAGIMHGPRRNDVTVSIEFYRFKVQRSKFKGRGNGVGVRRARNTLNIEP